MATINEIQDEIIEEFAGFDDWMDKYQLLIDLGSEQTISGVDYLPRVEQGAPGSIKDYRVYVY